MNSSSEFESSAFPNERKRSFVVQSRVSQETAAKISALEIATGESQSAVIRGLLDSAVAHITPEYLSAVAAQTQANKLQAIQNLVGSTIEISENN